MRAAAMIWLEYCGYCGASRGAGERLRQLALYVSVILSEFGAEAMAAAAAAA